MSFSIAAFPDIHGSYKNIKMMAEQLAEVNVIILVGDMTNGELSSIDKLLNHITPYNENILSVCGNWDGKYMEDYLTMRGMSIHGRHRIVNDLAFLGCGGSLPKIGGYVFREHEYRDILKQANKGLSPEIPKILVSHQPPYGTKLDRIYSGKQVGSHAIRQFIEDEQPILCFTGHIHEAIGIDSIGKTQIINPGMIEGSNRFAYAEIEKGIVTKLELRRANPQG